MPGKKPRWLAALVLLLGLLTPTYAHAEHGVPCDCDPGSYPKRNYRFYYLSRLIASHGPKTPMYAPERGLGLPPTYSIQRFPCPYATPQELYNFQNKAQ